MREFLKTAEPSDRLIVQDSAENELYKGFVGCMEYDDIDTSREVIKHKIYTEIFRKVIKKVGAIRRQELGEQVENISDFAFADLEMRIYTKVILEDSSKLHGEK